MKSGWEKYASEKRYIQKGYLRKHCDGGSGRKANQASRRDSLQQSREEEDKILRDLMISSASTIKFSKEEELPSPPITREDIDRAIQQYGTRIEITGPVVCTSPMSPEEQAKWDIYCQTLEEYKDLLKTECHDEAVGEKDVSKTHQERRQGIQKSDQRRCETEEKNPSKTKGKIMKKQSTKEKKHEAKETKAHEKKEAKKKAK
jgi:hypothetical protein